MEDLVYSEPITLGENDSLVIVKDFINQCKLGLIGDREGFGIAAKDGKVSYVKFRPSEWVSLPKDATHIIWSRR